MESAAIITISAVAAIVILALGIYITRLYYEHRFKEWCTAQLAKFQAEIEQARRAAITQSRAVLGGKFTEQLVPFFPGFKYDPTEVRFIGSPVDMIVFPGLAQGDPREIVILEVKTGKHAQLTSVQKKIRQLIENGMVRWDELYQKGEAC